MNCKLTKEQLNIVKKQKLLSELIAECPCRQREGSLRFLANFELEVLKVVKKPTWILH
jgi:hypothetical protein